MCEVPIPSTANDSVDRRIFRPPLEISANFFGAGYQDGRVAAPPGSFLRGDRVACDLAGGRDHFADARTFVVADVVDELAVGVQSTQYEKMRHRQIVDVD